MQVFSLAVVPMVNILWSIGPFNDNVITLEHHTHSPFFVHLQSHPLFLEIFPLFLLFNVSIISLSDDRFSIFFFHLERSTRLLQKHDDLLLLLSCCKSLEGSKIKILLLSDFRPFDNIILQPSRNSIGCNSRVFIIKVKFLFFFFFFSFSSRDQWLENVVDFIGVCDLIF